MQVLQLFFILGTKVELKKSSTAQYTQLFTFGFKAGGNFSLTMENSQNKIFYLGVLNKSTNKLYKKSQELIDNVCKKVNPFEEYGSEFDFTGHRKITISKTINSTFVAYFILISCSTGKWNIEINSLLTNPDSKIDSRYDNLKYVNPIAVSLFLLVFILWLINWFCYCKTKIPLHHVITCTFAFILPVTKTILASNK